MSSIKRSVCLLAIYVNAVLMVPLYVIIAAFYGVKEHSMEEGFLTMNDWIDDRLLVVMSPAFWLCRVLKYGNWMEVRFVQIVSTWDEETCQAFDDAYRSLFQTNYFGMTVTKELLEMAEQWNWNMEGGLTW